jgi:hypothetical protein
MKIVLIILVLGLLQNMERYFWGFIDIFNRISAYSELKSVKLSAQLFWYLDLLELITANVNNYSISNIQKADSYYHYFKCYPIGSN